MDLEKCEIANFGKLESEPNGAKLRRVWDAFGDPPKKL
jgi:hypothetical protein